MGQLHLKNPKGFEWREFGPDRVMVITLDYDVGEFSDGYHSFNDLYEHRFELFVALMMSNPEISFRAKLNHDGGQYPGWIVAGMWLPNGQVSYHLPERYWDRLDTLPTYERYPNYDVHTSQDVIERLRVWSGVKASSQIPTS